MGQIGASGTAPYTRYDLLNADERITEVSGFVERERARLDGLPPDTDAAVWVGRVLAAMERTLHQFQEHRRRIEDELKGAEGSARAKPLLGQPPHARQKSN